jgi:hypothetical protein
MKAILEFTLPEDQPEFNNAIKGGDWKHVCWEMAQYLRAQIKYAPDEMSQEKYDALEEVREEFNRIMNENNVDIYANE